MPADSNIQTIADRKDKNIKVNPMFGGKQNAAFQQIFSGRADAIGSNSSLVDADLKKVTKAFLKWPMTQRVNLYYTRPVFR